MGRTAKEENSDGIEIISIGKLYTGPWDKKYWSSSRGKDRYPYPVGYKSVRIQNGVTYTMEILEGLKGPSFAISSTDGKSCSGGTPDIAWEGFQKKGCSKLWHGRRFSCKIDGVEFFGFKNTFVQRLLRELVANVAGTADQCLLSANISCQLQPKPSSPDPDLLTSLVKSHVKGKRSWNDKVVNSKQHNGTHSKQCQQDECTMKASSSNSKQRDQLTCGSSDISTFVAVNEVSEFCYSPGELGIERSAAVMENEKYLPVSGRDEHLDSVDRSNHLKVECTHSQEEKEPSSSMDNCELNLNNLLQDQEPNDRSRYVAVQESNNLIPEEKGKVTNVQHDMPVVSDADCCIPDILYHAADSCSISFPKDNSQAHWVKKDAIVNDVAKSEVLVTDSLPEDEVGTSYNTSSEKFEADSVGQEIAKSMMTVLLPRAVPLLKTFSRRKKKSAKPATTISTDRSHEETSFPKISMNDATIERKNEKACIPCAGHDSVVSTSGNSDSVVADSFDNDDPQDMLPRADAAEAGPLTCGLDPCVLLPINVNGEANRLLSHSEIKEHDMNLHCKRQTTLSDSPKIDTGTADVTLAAARDTVLASLQEVTSNSKRARLDCHSTDKLPSVHAATMKGTSGSHGIICGSSSCMHEKSEARFAKLCKDSDFADHDNSTSNFQIPSTNYPCSMTEYKEINDDSRLNIQQKVKLNSKQQGLLELFACYVHPMPISMVQLVVKDNEIFISVKCGYLDHKESTLFVYKALRNGEKMGCPSLIGHVPIALQNSKNVLGRDIAVEKSFLQLTPDAQSFVLLNSIRTPYCREGKLHCSCPACASDCFQDNAVKIVRLNRGYASLVKRLETTQCVCCLLVCEPRFLLAAEEGGKVKLWIMNSGWSGHEEDWYLPTVDCMFPTIVELKTIPKSASLVVGHNGYGEFCLWDIEKRNLVSRFSSPGMSVLECVPANVFRWQTKVEHKMETLVDQIMDATRMQFSERSQNCIVSPENKDVAVWLLISTLSDPDSQYYQPCDQEANTVGCWRLALLINNMVITGSAVDAGVAAVTSVGQGIIGRSDGLVYVWELSTGMKLGNLHSFKGSKVSFIATDTSCSGALAAASGGQLLVYVPS